MSFEDFLFLITAVGILSTLIGSEASFSLWICYVKCLTDVTKGIAIAKLEKNPFFKDSLLLRDD